MSRPRDVLALTLALLVLLAPAAGAVGAEAAPLAHPPTLSMSNDEPVIGGRDPSLGPLSPLAVTVSDGEELRNALATAAANGRDDVIVLEAGSYLAASDGPFTYAASEPFSLTLTSDVVLEPADVIIDGEEITRGLRLENTAAGGIVLAGLTIQDGRATDASGGGAYIDTLGSVRVASIIARRNRLTSAGPPVGGDGAGLFVKSEGATATITGTVLEENDGVGSGGGLYLQGWGALTVAGSRFARNSCGFYESGGGAYVRAGSDGSIVLRDNEVADNVAYYGGGCAIDAGNGDIQVTGNRVSDNWAAISGGGLSLSNDYGDTLVDGNLVLGNETSDGSGGGVSIGGGVLAGSTHVGGQVTLRDNTVRQNHAGGSGGGIALTNALDVLGLNNVVADNTTYGGGAGLSVASKAGLVALINNTVARNEGLNAGPRGGGVHVTLGDDYDATADARLYNNIVFANLMDEEADDVAVVNHPDQAAVYGQVTVHHNDYGILTQNVVSYTVDLAGNIHADPLFADPYVGNYRLTAGSACVDAGDDAAPNLPAADRAGQPRIAGAHVDLGAYEGPLSVTPAAGPLQLVGQIGGSLNSVTVDGGRAYVGIGPRLAVLDVSNPASPALLGWTGPRGAGDVVLAGNRAYGTAGAAGLGIVDVSDPTHPTALGFYKTGAAARDVAYAGSHAYVVYGDRGLRILDVSDPAHPTKVGELAGLSATCSVAVSGDHAFVGDCGAWSMELHVIDVSDPAHPSEVTSYPLGGAANRLLIAGSRAYVAAGFGGLKILDLSDPENPSEMGAYPIPGFGNAYDVALSGTRAYVAAGNGMYIVDVSNPAAPTERGSYPMTNEARRVAVAGGLAYVVEGRQGLRILNVSNPANVTDVGFYDATSRAPQAAYDLAVNGSRAYVADYWRGVSSVDVSNPSNPSALAFFDVDTSAGEGVNRVVAANGRVYAGTCPGGLRILDAAGPASLAQTGIYTGTACVSGLDVTGNRAFAADLYGLDIVDVSNPAAPARMGVYDKLNVSDVAVTGDTAYVTDWTTGLNLVDVTNPAKPAELGSYQAGFNSDANAVAVAGETAYVAASMGAYGSLRMVDVSNPITPTEMSDYKTYPGSGWDVEVDGRYAFFASGSGGLQILDVANVRKPRRAHVFGAVDARGVAVDDGTVYLAAFEEGLYILRFQAPLEASVSAEGGTVAFPSAGTSYTFGPGTFADATTLIHRALDPSQAPSPGVLVGIGRAYDVSAWDTTSGEPVTPAQPYTVTIAYTDAERGGVIEETLALFSWDSTGWVKEPTSRVDAAANTVTATPDHFSTWAVLGETKKVFLPLVLRGR